MAMVFAQKINPESAPKVPSIVKALHRQMKDRSVKTRRGCFNLLTEMVSVAPGCLSDHVAILLPGIQFSLADKTSNMKIDALGFVGHLLTSHPGPVFHRHAPVIVPAVIAAVADPFYKIASEALMVLETLVKVLRPLPPSKTEKSFDFAPYSNQVS